MAEVQRGGRTRGQGAAITRATRAGLDARHADGDPARARTLTGALGARRDTLHWLHAGADCRLAVPARPGPPWLAVALRREPCPVAGPGPPRPRSARLRRGVPAQPARPARPASRGGLATARASRATSRWSGAGRGRKPAKGAPRDGPGQVGSRCGSGRTGGGQARPRAPPPRRRCVRFALELAELTQLAKPPTVARLTERQVADWRGAGQAGDGSGEG